MSRSKRREPAVTEVQNSDLNESETDVEYARYGSERLRSFFRFFGIESPLDDQSRDQ
jgi:hypothetical protein